ncbi:MULTISPECIES: hypothetical protein [Paenarthrobacter]|nr:hypothetical protein [Paenarthrobacter nitroguajacolicus]
MIIHSVCLSNAHAVGIARSTFEGAASTIRKTVVRTIVRFSGDP